MSEFKHTPTYPSKIINSRWRYITNVMAIPVKGTIVSTT